MVAKEQLAYQAKMEQMVLMVQMENKVLLVLGVMTKHLLGQKMIPPLLIKCMPSLQNKRLTTGPMMNITVSAVVMKKIGGRGMSIKTH